MIHIEQVKKLSECYTTLSGIADELDGNRELCDCCGRDSWNNLTEGRLAREVEAMARKTLKCISLIKNELR